MAFFAVSIEKIDTVRTHPNADSLDLCTLEGMTFQFVMGRDTAKKGDEVVYFPIDSVFPPAVIAKLPEAIAKKLSGKNHDRLRTVKLRGEISQGLAFKTNEFPLGDFGIKDPLPKYITEQLGITKYDPPVIDSGDCRRIHLPDESPYYDIEGCERYGDILGPLMTEDVGITEKIEGTNFSIVKRKDEEGVHVCQRSFEIIPTEGAINKYWETAKIDGIVDKITQMSKDLGATITLRGELTGPGIQGNIYKLARQTIYVFDIMVNGNYLNFEGQVDLCSRYKINMVPIIYKGRLDNYLNGKTVQEMSNGLSVLCSGVKREGIVIKPLFEKTEVQGFGRVILKQRSPEYLAESKL